MSWMTSTPKWARSRDGALVYMVINAIGFVVMYPVMATALWIYKTVKTKKEAGNENTENKHKKT